MSGKQRLWSWQHAIVKSDLPATTRHVLLTIAVFMNGVGEGCYPSIQQLCEASGLSKRVVILHLKTAREAGWLEVSEHGFRGRAWRRSEYRAAWPSEGQDEGSKAQGEPGSEDGSEGEDDAGKNAGEGELCGCEGGNAKSPRQARGGYFNDTGVVTESNRVIENRPIEQYSDPSDRDAGPPKAAPVRGGGIWKKVLFGDLLPRLASLTGQGEGQVRKLIGKWLSETGGDAKRVCEAIEAALEDPPAHAASWISARLVRPGRAAARRPGYLELKRRDEEKAARSLGSAQDRAVKTETNQEARP